MGADGKLLGTARSGPGPLCPICGEPWVLRSEQAYQPTVYGHFAGARCTARADSWAVDERIAREELARGEGVTFDSAEAATRWLASDD